MWQLHQLEKLAKLEPNLVEEALYQLMDHDHELRDKLVFGAYLDGDINLSKAAELLNEPSVQLRQQLLALGMPVKLGTDSEEALIAETFSAAAIRKGGR